jgi:hypothetical protein
MPVEAATYISDFSPTLPGVSDLESEGDDHLRLIKLVLQNTFPRTGKSFYFPTTTKTVGNYTVSYPSDQNTTQFIDASGGAATVTLPNPTGVNADGWSIDIVKYDSSANTVTINPGANTINGVSATYVFATQWQDITLTWSTAFNGWLLFDNVVPFATTSSPGRVQLATQAEAGTGTNNSHAVTPLALYQPEQSIASAGTVDLSVATSENIQITGNTGPIVSFGNAAAGIRRMIRFASNPTVTYNAGTMILPGGASITVSAGDNWEAFSLGASAWLVRFIQTASGKGFASALPTTQRFLSGSGTYNPTAGVTKIRVRMCGGGGGGGATSTNAGANGNQSLFGSWTANGGNGGGAGAGGTGGTGGASGTNGTGNLVVRFQGGQGGGGGNGTGSNTGIQGGMGGANPFGGAGGAGKGFNSAAQGNDGVANTGAGGGGGGGFTTSPAGPGAGGGAGEYVEFWVNAPGATTYTVGASVLGGAAGTWAGGGGAAGIIIVEEWYN